MQGKDKETYTGVAKFLDFLAKPENAAEWHQKTGYLPITKAAYDLTREQGFYEKTRGGYRDTSDAEQTVVTVHQRTTSGQHAADQSDCG